MKLILFFLHFSKAKTDIWILNNFILFENITTWIRNQIGETKIKKLNMISFSSQFITKTWTIIIENRHRIRSGHVLSKSLISYNRNFATKSFISAWKHWNYIIKEDVNFKWLLTICAMNCHKAFVWVFSFFL